MGKALIIGAGGVAGVVVHKCCQNSEVFTEICIASRTKSKCDALKAAVEAKSTKTVVTTAQVDANKVEAGYCHQRGVAVSGFDHYGCVPCNQGRLCGHRKL